jgi:hypothetical protein
MTLTATSSVLANVGCLGPGNLPVDTITLLHVEGYDKPTLIRSTGVSGRCLFVDNRGNPIGHSFLVRGPKFDLDAGLAAAPVPEHYSGIIATGAEVIYEQDGRLKILGKVLAINPT